LRVDQARNCEANIEMNKSTHEWMREEARANREEARANREILALLLDRTGVKPLLSLEPASTSPPQMLLGEALGSNNSNASSPTMIVNVVPPLLLESPVLAPLPPSEEIFTETSLDKELEEAIRERKEGKAEAMSMVVDFAKIGHNLIVNAFEMELGRDSLPIEDPPTVCAQ
jgi:hypothetical protein